MVKCNIRFYIIIVIDIVQDFSLGFKIKFNEKISQIIIEI